MTELSWADVTAAITPLKPRDLDGLIEEITPNDATPKGLTFPVDAAAASSPMTFKDENTVCFGARITKDTQNKVALAMTLAQMATENGGFPIILSHLDVSGMEQYGFRVERIGGSTPEEIAACEAQVCAFWNIVMVI